LFIAAEKARSSASLFCVPDQQRPSAPHPYIGEDKAKLGRLTVEELKKNAMMAHLIDSLEQGKDIGHYGRLVFAMVARHFLPPEELEAMLVKDHDFSAEQAQLLIRQVEGKDYNPPKRDRILAWQKEQDFPICPNAEDPDACNVYKDLNFPKPVYDHIQHYQEQKVSAES
jgi:hypothetical protein